MTACLLLFVLTIHPAASPRCDLAAAIRMYGVGEYQKAVETLSQQSPENSRAADLWLWLGKSYFRLRRWDDAIRGFERAELVDPSNSLYHLWLGRAFGRKAEHSPFFLALGPARRVLKEFETAVRLSPGSVDARFDLLEFYLNAPGIIGGGRDHARAQIEEIARVNPRLGRTARARLYEDEKRFDLARQELTQATVEFPDQPAAFVDLADYLFRRMDYAEAEPYARKAVEMTQPPDNKARLELFASWVRLGKNQSEAEKGLKILSLGPLDDDDPSFDDVYYWLGQARLAQGKKAEARQAFETALRYNSDHPRTKAALALLR